MTLLLDHGLSQLAIADPPGVDRRTVHRWIASGVTERVAGAPRTRGRRQTKMAPSEWIIRERLATYPELSAVRLVAGCGAAGLPGNYTQLKCFV
jgi:transposase